MPTRTTPPTLCLAVLLLLALPSAVARAQVPIETGRGTYISPDTGREFNNPTSAYLDSAMLRQANMNRIMSQALMNQLLIDETFNRKYRAMGQETIDAGHATAAVPAWDDESVGWLMSDDLEGSDRDAAAKMLRADWAAYADFARSRGADPDDMADVIALAAVVGYEHFRDQPTTRRQFTSLADAIRPGLLGDALYQGKGTRGAAELAGKWAFATLALERNAAEAKTDEEKRQVREAGGVLIGGLYTTPADALEPVDDGFVDRGERVVKEGKGTTTFRRVTDDLAAARQLTEGEFVEVPFNGATLFGEGDERPYEARLAEAKEHRSKELAAALGKFREDVKERGLPADDLAAGAAHATALLWPIAATEDTPLTPAQVESARTLFAADIVADPAFQRMNDAARQKLYDAWAYRAMAAVEDAEQSKVEAAAAAESAKSDDPMTRMLGLSQQNSADASRNIARNKASALLGDFFSPRELEKVTLEAEGFEVAP